MIAGPSAVAHRPAAGTRHRTATTFRAFDVLLLAGALLLVFSVAGPALTIPLQVPLNYNEGWDALWQTRAVTPGTGPLYPPADTWVFDNYPPLGFCLVGALGRWVFGDMIVAGRVVALASLLGAGALAGLCVRALGGRRRPAIASALLVPLFVCFFFRIYVAVDDPQWLAQAIMLGGLAVVLGVGGTDRLVAGTAPAWPVAVGAVLVVAGGFVKHNLVALPIAVTAWLLIVNRRAAGVWIAAAAAAIVAGAAVIAVIWGHDAFADVLHHGRVYRLSLLKYAGEALGPMVPMALVAVVLLVLARRRNWSGRTRGGALFAALYGAVALVTGIGQRYGEGVYYNAHFETLVALAIGFGLALSPLFAPPAQRPALSDGPVALTLLAALPLIIACHRALPQFWADIHDRDRREASWRGTIDRIAAADGPAGCLMMSLCYWAGRPSAIDMFNLTEKSELARIAPLSFRRAVAARYFAIVEDDPASFTHNDARVRAGYDPVMSLFPPFYRVVFRGPDGIVLLAPTPDGARERPRAPPLDPAKGGARGTR